jgi:tRNA U34 5-carboxymethylaminomethyl modifying enzyme MnmG/GidA
LETRGSDTDNFSAALHRLEAEVEDVKDKNTNLEADLKKEKESKVEMEERYKRYLEKVAVMIRRTLNG